MTTKEERLKALNNMLEESFDIAKVYDDNRIAVLSEIISGIENDEMEYLRARNYALSSQMLSMTNDNLEITETQRNEYLKLVIDDARKTCNDFNEPMISLGTGIAIGIVIKHINELLPKGVTNGDMIKAMFPNIEVDEIKTNTGGYIEVKYLDTTDKCDATAFRKDWWNAPYKG